MDIIAVYPNLNKDVDLILTRKIINIASRRNKKVLIPAHVMQRLSGSDAAYCTAMDDDALFASAQAVVTLGGDGTFLGVARKSILHQVPLLGVNLGHVGFLAEVEKDQLEVAMESLFDGEYEIQQRMALRARIISREGNIIDRYALNDIIIARASLSRIVNINIQVDDAVIDSYPGDGLIVSTPTGSTAYSLSAGGPIIEPGVDLVLLTPICPHTLHSRPVIVGSRRTLHITVHGNGEYEAMATIDGQEGHRLSPGDVIEVVGAKEKVKMVKLFNKNFYDILRNKIFLREEAKNR